MLRRGGGGEKGGRRSAGGVRDLDRRATRRLDVHHRVGALVRAAHLERRLGDAANGRVAAHVDVEGDVAHVGELLGGNRGESKEPGHERLDATDAHEARRFTRAVRAAGAVGLLDLLAANDGTGDGGGDETADQENDDGEHGGDDFF
eukprot:scaffold39246_cov59-Phaeocystis_antarctica.AAC.3